VTPGGHEAAAVVFDIRDRPKPIELDLFCGIRRYVALLTGRWLSTT
jgi:hypothetical protein